MAHKNKVRTRTGGGNNAIDRKRGATIVLERALRKLSLLTNPAMPRRPTATAKFLQYRQPKHTKLGLKCRACGRLRSDHTAYSRSALCAACYRAKAQVAYERKLAIRAAKMRLAARLTDNAE